MASWAETERVLMKALQAMLLQTDGQQIFLMPAWPADWDVEFKLHAPGRTVLEGSIREGRMRGLRVSPSIRRADVAFYFCVRPGN